MMNKAFQILAFGFATFLVTFPLLGEDLKPTKPKWKQLVEAYGFVIGQEASLSNIESDFPDLRNKVANARTAFESSALGEASAGVRDELQREFGDVWPKLEKRLKAEFSAMIQTPASLRQASAFINQVERRAEGQMEPRVRATLLSANPRYAKTPVAEFAEGWRRQEALKHDELAITLEVPLSWKERAPLQKFFLRSFRNYNGNGLALCNVKVEAPVPTFTKQEVRKIAGDDRLMRQLMPAGYKVRSTSFLQINDAPALEVIADTDKVHMDVSIKMRACMYLLFPQDSHLMLVFNVSEVPQSELSLDENFDRHLALFKAMAASVVVHEIPN